MVHPATSEKTVINLYSRNVTRRHRFFLRFLAFACSLPTGLDAHGGNYQNGCGARFDWKNAVPYVGDRGVRKDRVSVIFNPVTLLNTSMAHSHGQ